MKNIKYREIICKSAINKIKNRSCRDLNIYRGCIHGCIYCYAIYSHSYINSRNFFDEIFVKKNIVEILEKELSSKNWKRDMINLGSVTDSYQKIETRYKFMPEILKLFIKYKTPINIFTKSDLILRDYELIDKLSKITRVNIAFTITTIDEKLASLLEPNVVSPNRRFTALKEFTKTNASVGVNILPIIPYITENGMEELFKNIKRHGIHYAIYGILNLKGECRKIFLNFIRTNFPNLYKKYLYLYGTWHEPKKEYTLKIYKTMEELKKKYISYDKREYAIEDISHINETMLL